jgi:hypothetical protein
MGHLSFERPSAVVSAGIDASPGDHPLVYIISLVAAVEMARPSGAGP